MKQLPKRTRLRQITTLAATALKTDRLWAGLRYRLSHEQEPPPPVAVPELEVLTHGLGAANQMSFTFALIGLSARVASVNGKLSREKYVAFRAAFPLSGGICGKIRTLFSLAVDDKTSFEHYVTQIKYAFPRQMALFASLLDRLFSIAAADGSISREEDRMLAKISHMFELSPAQYMDIRSRHLEPKKAHEVLGVEKRVTAERVKKRYYELMKRYHPDKHASTNLSPEVEMLLRLKISEINSAYTHLRRRAA